MHFPVEIFDTKFAKRMSCFDSSLSNDKNRLFMFFQVTEQICAAITEQVVISLPYLQKYYYFKTNLD